MGQPDVVQTEKYVMIDFLLQAVSSTDKSWVFVYHFGPAKHWFFIWQVSQLIPDLPASPKLPVDSLLTFIYTSYVEDVLSFIIITIFYKNSRQLGRVCNVDRLFVHWFILQLLLVLSEPTHVSICASRVTLPRSVWRILAGWGWPPSAVFLSTTVMSRMEISVNLLESDINQTWRPSLLLHGLSSICRALFALHFKIRSHSSWLAVINCHEYELGGIRQFPWYDNHHAFMKWHRSKVRFLVRLRESISYIVIVPTFLRTHTMTLHAWFDKSSIDMMQFFSNMPVFFTETNVVLTQS